MNPQDTPAPSSPPIGAPLQGGQPVPPSPKQQIAGQIESATNVLVTVSNDPSVDQLAAAIGFTLVLNKLGKHATAVFSGKIPSTIEFLQPEKTFEKNTDSLRDFIIALDKSKADKLRYKVEDTFVKIFITPYHTSLSDKDLEFSQGDFNVDVIFALGVKTQNELDQAITAHGRILHDATVISINSQPGANLGAVNLNEPTASSLSEILVNICDFLKPEQGKLIDAQVATAFLTGIVAETRRFSNNKTKPQTMNAAARLMNAGANQQLVVSKLEKPQPLPPMPPKPPKPPILPPPPPARPVPPPPPPPPPAHVTMKPPPPPPKTAEGSLSISHAANAEDSEGDEDDKIEKIHIDDEGTLQRLEELKRQQAEAGFPNDEFPETPPKSTPATAPPSNPVAGGNGGTPQAAVPSATSLNLPPVSESPLKANERTLSDIEQSVHSKHLTPQSQVSTAVSAQPQPPAAAQATPATVSAGPPNNPNDGLAFPSQLVSPDNGLTKDQTAGNGNPSPPPVPPPFMVPPEPGQDSLATPDNGIPI